MLDTELFSNENVLHFITWLTPQWMFCPHFFTSGIKRDLKPNLDSVSFGKLKLSLQSPIHGWIKKIFALSDYKWKLMEAVS